VADGIEVDFSDVLKLAADLGEVPKNAGPRIRSAVEKTSVDVKNDSRESVSSGSASWKALPRAIDYTIKAEAGSTSTITSEIGYSKGRGSGKLGNLREFGAPGKNLAPHNDLANALSKNQNDFQHGLEQALSDAEREAGL